MYPGVDGQECAPVSMLGFQLGHNVLTPASVKVWKQSYHCQGVVRGLQEVVRRLSGGCQEIVRGLSGGCQGGCQEVVRGLSGGCQGVVRGLSGGCQEVVRGLSGGCQEVVRRLAGDCQGVVRGLSEGVGETKKGLPLREARSKEELCNPLPLEILPSLLKCLWQH